jgi:serine/threonine protein phosphatase PrpC
MISIKEITFLNEIGQRPQLEDSIYPPAGGATYSDKLFLVCDGVGGESMGEEASRIACEEFAAFFHQNPPGGGKPDAAYINQVQKQVLQKMALFVGRHPEAARMSTTLTLVYLDDEGISVAWCGDSRIYHLHDGGVHWRSTDHSLVANLVKHGEISEEEARKHPQRNVITRSLSAGASAFPIDTYYINDVRNGDYLMLCTDGVLEQITEQKLGGILNNPHDKKELFLTYCGGKTKDNFSLYLLGLQSDSQPVMKKTVKPIVPVMLALIIALAVLGTVFMTPIKKFFSPDNKPHPAKPKDTIHAAAPIPTV